MKKLIIACLVLALMVVTVFADENQTNTTTTCTDSDGGINYYVKGTLTIQGKEGYLTDACQIKTGNASYTSTDSCFGNDCYLEEAYCYSSSKSYRTYPADYYNCPNGCKDGACLSTAQPSITVLSPNGGESWVMNSSQTIKWVSHGTHVTISLVSLDKTKEVYGLLGSIPNDGTETMWLPSDLPLGQYYLRVRCVGNCTASTQQYDDSDAPFSIVATNTTLSCTDSDGGIDYYKKGTVTACTTGTNSGGSCTTSQDVCNSDSKRLKELYCDSNAMASVEYSCPNGCSNGACIRCEDYRYSTCPSTCIKECVPSSCSGNVCTADCEGKGSCVSKPVASCTKCENGIDTGKKDSNGCPIYECPTSKCGDGKCQSDEIMTVCEETIDCKNYGSEMCPTKCYQSTSCNADCLPNCGNGVCDEIKCLGTGCPITETSQNCPQDCEKKETRYVNLGQKFELSQGGSAVVSDYKNMKVTLNDIRSINVPCIPEEQCPPYLEARLTVSMSGGVACSICVGGTPTGKYDSNGCQIYECPEQPIPTVEDGVKCVFQDSKTEQKCYSEKGSCSGIETCVVYVKGIKGEQVTWKSSCGGYAYTTMDAENDYAYFNCQTQTTCTDSDGSPDYSKNIVNYPISQDKYPDFFKKGVGKGIYVGATQGINVIYGTEPDPQFAKVTNESYSTYYDFCLGNELNEAYCRQDNKLGANSIQCPNGCKDGACITDISTETRKLGTKAVIENINKDAGSVTIRNTGTYELRASETKIYINNTVEIINCPESNIASGASFICNDGKIKGCGSIKVSTIGMSDSASCPATTSTSSSSGGGSSSSISSTGRVTATQTTTSSGGGSATKTTVQRLCTADAKLCPDGSYVGRDSNNNCEFRPCPSTTSCSWRPRADNDYGLCKGFFSGYYFNGEKCTAFSISGCGGPPFKSLDECKRACESETSTAIDLTMQEGETKDAFGAQVSLLQLSSTTAVLIVNREKPIYLTVSTDKSTYDLKEPVKISVYTTGQTSGNIVTTVTNPYGVTTNVKMDAGACSASVCPACPQGKDCVPCPPQETRCSYSGTYYETKAEGRYRVHARNEKGSDDKINDANAFFTVIDNSKLDKYLILKDIDGFSFVKAETSAWKDYTIYVAEYNKNRNQYMVGVVDFGTREGVQKFINEEVMKYNPAVENTIEGYYIYTFSSGSQRAYLWTYKSFVIYVVEQSRAVTETTQTLIAEQAQTRISQKPAAVVSKAMSAISESVAAQSSVSITGKVTAQETVISPIRACAVCDGGTFTGRYDDYGCPVYVCPMVNIPKELLIAYLDRYPSDVKSIDTDCEAKGGYCMITEAMCKSGYSDSDYLCSSSSKCCIKEVGTTEFMQIVLKLERMKIGLDSLQKNSDSLAKYYDSTGDSANAEKYREISKMFGVAKDKINNIIAKIRNNIDNPSAIIEQIKADIKDFKGYLKEILKRMVSQQEVEEYSSEELFSEGCKILRTTYNCNSGAISKIEIEKDSAENKESFISVCLVKGYNSVGCARACGC